MQNNWRRLFGRDLPVLISFVLVATLMWWVRAMNTSRDAYIHLRATYTGVGGEYLFTTPPADELLVQVHDSGRRIRMLVKENPTVELNATPLLQHDQGSLVLSTEQIQGAVQHVLPGGMTLLSIRPEQISADYYRQHKKTVPVHFAGTVSPDAQYQLCDSVKIVPEVITIYGKKDDIAHIAYIQTEAVAIAQVRDSLRQTIALQPIEHIRFEQDRVTLLCQGEQFTEKRFTLPIEIMGAPADCQVRFFPAQAEVVVRVGIAYFPYLTPEDIQLYCQYPERPINHLKIIATTTNPHITNMRVTPGIVEYLIE